MFMRERRKLFDKTMQDMKQGKLSMGDFILEANRIDAEESGKEFDAESAKKLYHERLRKFNAFLGKPDHDLAEALHKTLKGLDYFGTPNGWLGDLLNNKGGSCVPISHLGAALLYDADMAEHSYLRVYGADKSGIGHLAPIFMYMDKELGDEYEYDIASGKDAYKKGVRFHVTDLPKLYGIKHGFLPPDAIRKEVRLTQEMALDMTDSFVYPHSTDPFPGKVPLFSFDAFGDPGINGGAPAELQCDNLIKLSVLDPIPRRPDDWPSAYQHATTVEPPLDKQALNNFFRCIERLKREGPKGKTIADRLNHLADLSAHFTTAMWYLNLLNKPKLAKKADDEIKSILNEARSIESKIRWGRVEGDMVHSMLAKPLNMNLIFLDKTGIRLLEKAKRVGTLPEVLAMYLAHLRLRDGVLRNIERHRLWRRDPDSRAEAMVFLFKQDVFIDVEKGTEFERVYEAFRRVMHNSGWDKSIMEEIESSIPRLSLAEVQKRLRNALKDEKRGEGWAHYIIYYAKNFLHDRNGEAIDYVKRTLAQMRKDYPDERVPESDFESIEVIQTKIRESLQEIKRFRENESPRAYMYYRRMFDE
jgi:hypothetical protein